MSEKLSKSAQAVQDVLSRKGFQCSVIELASGARTAQEAADTLGCTVAQIIKSLIFKTKDENQPILVLVSGRNRVNEKLLETHVGKVIIKADAEFTRDVTGFAIGGIPPLGHKQKIDTFIDKDLLNFDELWAAAGTPHAVFSLKSSDLVVLTEGKIISVMG